MAARNLDTGIGDQARMEGFFQSGKSGFKAALQGAAAVASNLLSIRPSLQHGNTDVAPARIARSKECAATTERQQQQQQQQ
eukprot:CAMPEP_0172755254 /NCGR_PEP_ID=MMETSP1074-20121228/159510_1 /TAXON_ID=2916 /ORGANISM="Ceratium fusus, Strain PA161109" /LENGTH=80 /DNA_ID=CAMNT_0013588317 /DNA_START=14 /DNA_END=253 /DNA_ORIENTATION=-